MNALKHGLRSAETVARRKEFAALMREVREMMALERQAANDLKNWTPDTIRVTLPH